MKLKIIALIINELREDVKIKYNFYLFYISIKYYICIRKLKQSITIKK